MGTQNTKQNRKKKKKKLAKKKIEREGALPDLQ